MEYTNDELMHYGVLGMRWGVRKDASKAYLKALRKKRRIESKSQELTLKSSKKMRKGMRLINKSLTRPKIQKGYNLVGEASELNLKSAKLQKKGNKWVKQMDEVFSEFDIQRIPKGNITSGKNFIYRRLYGDDSYNITKRQEPKSPVGGKNSK